MMSKKEITQLLEGMDPEQALAAVAGALKKIFPVLGDEVRLRFLADLMGDTSRDKVSSMVHL
jgi:hypothetical protein